MHNFIIYGGTFDPIHYGHIKTALDVQGFFHFERFVFLPCKIPVLKNQALATPEQRVSMMELALAPYQQQARFSIDLSELNRDTPSYMVDSLEYFRKQFGEELAITLLMGMDTFSQLHRWYQWSKLITLCNILVIDRAGFAKQALPDLVQDLLDKQQTFDANALKQKSHGLIYRYNAGQFDFSSSWIREQLSKNNELENYLPIAVLEYIKKNNLYP
ncbi:putative nicotinate-nucleotide adenylyltransferase [Legionella massiliensis]|uniref:Probable nicotinate-nucleotide adenylyltransferase n=1 Tax=Legionella massiliensis TaxID=1034943 RepID=A0A078L2Z2_9GAMM|nr:nicotinate-nucleotide adenylyltransferase [Legionella massiliensis]CDZ78363.1 putative nicotinate-nucleotide adenylyltransferase [Legionella massiliensis]CEE14101.1 putative nicotinate-nucleotide adenylyltransferase [Legionella massiliensis]